MEVKLVIIRGKANKAEVSLKLPCTIGRSREADLTIAHPMVSRQHCQLFEVEGLVRIRDLGSLNGTFVGNQQVKEADLYPNSEFSIGPLTFRIEYEYAGPLAGTPPVLAPVEQPPDGFGAGGLDSTLEGGELGAEEPAPLFAPLAGEVPDFDGGQPDASAWGAPAVEHGQALPPSEQPDPPPPQHVEPAVEEAAPAEPSVPPNLDPTQTTPSEDGFDVPDEGRDRADAESRSEGDALNRFLNRPE